MLQKYFQIEDFHYTYYVGISQIKLDWNLFLTSKKIFNEKNALEMIFKIIEDMQNYFQGSIIQFINEKHVLNEEHIYSACYFLQKAFLQRINISNKKNIELLLYLSTNRQIKVAIDALGITLENLRSGIITYCIITQDNNINQINAKILEELSGNEINSSFNNLSHEKINDIIKFFEFSDKQLITILKSYEINEERKNFEKLNLNLKFRALNDLIIEKMALLSLEKLKGGSSTKND